MLENYINDNNKEGKFAGDIEYTAACKLLNIKIILFTKGYLGLNVFNIYSPDFDDDTIYSNIYILFKNQEHFNYLEPTTDNTTSSTELDNTINNCIKKNLKELEKLRKKEYPLSLKWYPEI